MERINRNPSTGFFFFLRNKQKSESQREEKKGPSGKILKHEKNRERAASETGEGWEKEE